MPYPDLSFADVSSAVVRQVSFFQEINIYLFTLYKYKENWHDLEFDLSMFNFKGPFEMWDFKSRDFGLCFICKSCMIHEFSYLHCASIFLMIHCI